MTQSFEKVVELIRQRAPLHKKRLDTWLSSTDRNFENEAEDFFSFYFEYLAESGYSIEDVVDAYLGMCNTMLRYQVAFLRLGSYPKIDAESAKYNVYTKPDKMLPYMIGLAMSQFLWSTHYRIFEFYKNAIKGFQNDIKSYLEIGPAHGLYMRQMFMECNNIEKAIAVDISDISLNLTEKIINRFFQTNCLNRSAEFILGDVTEINFRESFDFITMGEILEHVDRPGELLNKISSLLSVRGKAFISTCANCPMIDHVIEFNRVGQIKELIEISGLTIIDELALPSELMSVSEAEEKRVTINYCAILEKK